MNKKRLLRVSIFLFCFLSLLLCVSIVYAKDIAYTESGNSITLDIKIPDIGISEIKDDDGNTYHKISIPDSNFVTNKEGSPQLPYISRNIHIPDQATNVSVTTQVNGSPAIYNDILVYPAPKTVIKTTEEGYEYIAEEFYIDQEAYQSPDIIPGQIAIITQDGYFRSVRMINLNIYPVRYTPKIKTLQLIKDLSLTITYTIDPSIPTKKDTTEGFDKLIDKLIINPESVERIEPAIESQVPAQVLTTQGSVTYITGSQLRDTTINCDYLIITHSAFFSSTELAEFANYRANHSKLNIVIAKVDDIYTQFPNTSGNDYSIKDFIQYAYDNWATSPQYLLIVGDVEYVPSHVWRPNGQSAFMDYEDWYVCLIGGDEWPDMAIGRFSVKDAADIRNIKEKVNSHEQSPINPGDYHKRALYVEGTIGSEARIINILLSTGFEVTELYKIYGNTKQNFINAVDYGQNFVYWRGHGFRDGWEYPFETLDIALLNNSNYPIIFTTSCSTANLDSSTDIEANSIGEEFVRTEFKGAAAYYGATVPAGASAASYEMLLTIFDSFEYNLGKAILLGEILDNSLLMSQEYILLGDPAMQVFGHNLIHNLPDLTVSSSGVNYDYLTHQLTVSISNIGETDAYNVSVDVFILNDLTGEKIPFGSCVFPIVAAGNNAQTIINLQPPLTGEHFVTAIIDPLDQIAESSNLNNQNGKRIIISPTFINITNQTGIVLTNNYTAIAKADINGDGFEDICLTNSNSPLLLFFNNGNGTFSNITVSSGLGNVKGDKVAFGDINNDGYPDLFVCKAFGNKLFLNNKNLTFADISVSSGVSGFSGRSGAIFGDINNDGYLDIYVTNFNATSDTNILLINNHDKTFKDETTIRGLGGLRSWDPAKFVDIDNDSDLDLIIICEVDDSHSYLRFYLNDGTGFFTEGTPPNIEIGGGPYRYVKTSDVAVSDIDLDGDLDLCYREYINEWKRIRLMRNNGGSDFESIYPSDLTTKIDLGYIFSSPLITEIDNVLGEDILWGEYIIRNSGTGTFKKYENTRYPDCIQGDECYRNILTLDLEMDGDIDIVRLLNSTKVLEVLKNQTTGTNWLKVKLIGVTSNRDAGGARVYVYSSQGGLVGHQEVSTQNPTPLHFGLDCNDTYNVVVHWPKSGITDTVYNVSSGQLLTISEGSHSSIIEGFEQGFGYWMADHDDRGISYSTSISGEVAYQGAKSVDIFINGVGDDGTSWIERTIHCQPNSKIPIKVSFWLYSDEATEVTAWGVCGYAGIKDPEEEGDFIVVGPANEVAGWKKYDYATDGKCFRYVNTDQTGQVWVAMGLTVFWETYRSYHIDYVTIETGVPTPNLPPVLEPIQDQVIDIGQPLSFEVIATDPDDTILEYTVQNLPVGASFVDNVFTWTPTINDVRNHTVTFEVSDGALSDSKEVIITVNDPNRQPILNPIGNRTGNEATNFVISKIIATDPDNDPITIEASNLPNGARFFRVSPTNIGRVEYKLSWPAKFVRQGVYENITFTACDPDGATDSETITITINDTQNFAPTLVPIRNRTGIVGRDFIIKGIVATDFDNDPITIEVQNAPPSSWVTQTSASNIGKVEYRFVWRARGITPGVHTLTFIARDPAGGIDSETITITIP